MGTEKKKEFGRIFIGRFFVERLSFVLRRAKHQNELSVVSRCETRHHMSGPGLFYERREELDSRLYACCVDVGIVRTTTG